MSRDVKDVSAIIQPSQALSDEMVPRNKECPGDRVWFFEQFVTTGLVTARCNEQ